MKIFLSWSGHRGRQLAEPLRAWLPDVVSHFEPWVSSEDIEKGARWSADLSRQLADTHLGIVCLTPESTNEPWVLFEAGALAKALDRSRVCTYLLALNPSQLTGPLVQFQATQATKEDTLRLLRTLNAELGTVSLPADRLNRVFEHWWPVLSRSIAAILPNPNPRQQRSERDLLEELIDLARQQAKAAKAGSLLSHQLDLIPFESLFFGPELDDFVAANEDRVSWGSDQDANAANWADDIRPSARHPIDGVWASRWNQSQRPADWHSGQALIATHGPYVLLLHTDSKYEYFMLAKWRDSLLVGRHYNVASVRDTSPWIGSMESPSRIDGLWSQGRWDLRRVDPSQS